MAPLPLLKKAGWGLAGSPSSRARPPQLPPAGPPGAGLHGGDDLPQLRQARPPGEGLQGGGHVPRVPQGVSVPGAHTVRGVSGSRGERSPVSRGLHTSATRRPLQPSGGSHWTLVFVVKGNGSIDGIAASSNRLANPVVPRQPTHHFCCFAVPTWLPGFRSIRTTWLRSMHSK